MATPWHQSDSLRAFIDDLDTLDDLDDPIKTEPHGTDLDYLTSRIHQTADRPPDELSEDTAKKEKLLLAIIRLLKKHSELEVVAHQLFPEGVSIKFPRDEDEVLEPAGADDSGDLMRSRDPALAPESGMIPFDPSYVPGSLRGQASKKTTKVYETMLWVRQGEVGKIKSVVIKPKGYAKPFQIICAQLSRSVARWADVELQPPDGKQSQAQVVTRFDEKAACFARIICFNKNLELTTNTKFDVTVDGNAEAFIVEARTYVRDFVGNLPIDSDRKPIDLVLGVGKSWLSIPLVHQSADRLIARCVIDAGRQLDTIPIHVDATDVRKQKIRTFLRQPQNHDWLLSWEPEEKKKGHDSRARRNGGGGRGGGHADYPSDDSDDGDGDDGGDGGLRGNKRRKGDASSSKVSSTWGSISGGTWFGY